MLARRHTPPPTSKFNFTILQDLLFISITTQLQSKALQKEVNIILHAGAGGVGEVKWTIYISVHRSRSIQQFGTMNVCNFIRNYITLVSPSCTITVNAHLKIVTKKMPFNKTNETQESYRLLLIRDILLP